MNAARQDRQMALQAGEGRKEGVHLENNSVCGVGVGFLVSGVGSDSQNDRLLAGHFEKRLSSISAS